MSNRKNKPVSIVMVGVGGYGNCYVNEIIRKSYEIVGVVDPYARQTPCFSEIKKQRIPVYSEINDFYNDGHIADLAIISSPIQCHFKQSITALKNGTNVLCEKPVSALVQEIDELIKVRDESGKWMMIGYQWSYSKAIQELKRDICTDVFGQPIRLKTLCFWPRDDAYYQRNNWAGKIKDCNGEWVFDSIINNAMAHFLHNLFYILGDETHLSANPKTVLAELYRANPIENYDTAACRIYTTQGTELLFYGSHATLGTNEAIFNFEFEDATISFCEFSKEIIAIDKDGNEKSYGSPDDDHHFLKLFEAVGTVQKPKPIVCGLEASRSQTLCMNAIQDSICEIKIFPDSFILRDENSKRYWVNGLDLALYNCYNNNILPHESSYSWANKCEPFDINSNYKFSV